MSLNLAVPDELKPILTRLAWHCGFPRRRFGVSKVKDDGSVSNLVSALAHLPEDRWDELKCLLQSPKIDQIQRQN